MSDDRSDKTATIAIIMLLAFAVLFKACDEGDRKKTDSKMTNEYLDPPRKIDPSEGKLIELEQR